ncbi:hypothetical protein A1O1_06935 [Capronia coronata CBS 617.96]|uniref:CENP-V/GFA domain-containing protein n=1 Tax=Capronia coronata CBS 617.96 TaxID=1182541 RepID=W9Y248_9EURO|nr:uncharacterized protein A1O1_06935 [Capronia coronata CBS 617.96]EXJ83316.1 hypothetical protein A1O1_06935 [Capronia coronata CBS 617.96]
MSSSSPHKGVCLCGNVEFEVHGKPVTNVLCHCVNCQKSSGSSFQANYFYEAKQFTLVKGKESITDYQDKNTDAGYTVVRSFCSNCGSNLYTINLDNPAVKDFIIVMTGCLDEQARAEFEPKQEYYCKRRQVWCPLSPSSQKIQAMV